MRCSVAFVCLGAMLVGSACEGGDPALFVDVLTNYRPGVEFDGVVISIHTADDVTATDAPRATSARHTVAARAGAPVPFRAAEIRGLAAGTHLVVARLLRGEAFVARGRVLLTTTGSSHAVTVTVTSECDGVECPGAGDPALTACLAGRCVDPRCGPAATEFCPPPVCAADDDCTAVGPPCFRGLCFSGGCASFADDALCSSGICDRALGCVNDVDAGGLDAGAMDSGVTDSGATDSGAMDSGADAGIAPLSSIVGIAASYQHTCAWTSGGDAFCWGLNDAGQLGDGTTTNRSRAVQVVGLDGVSEISVGRSHSCARRGAEVWCWGDNDFGQLGTGTGVDSPIPVLITRITGALQIASGYQHICARVPSAVHCWGRGDRGQLGSGTTIVRVPSPVTLAAGGTVTRVEAGQLHTCVLLTTGALRCTGLNFYGGLGDGTTVARSTPVATLLPSDVAGMGLGFGHTCATRMGGSTVSCFGDNGEGELGDGSTTPSATPVVAAGVTGVVGLAIGDFHSCARTGSQLRCWGRNRDGQLGDGSTVDRPTAILSSITDVVAAAAGGAHTCAVITGGQVACWGDNTRGQLGDGTTTDRLVPATVVR